MQSLLRTSRSVVAASAVARTRAMHSATLPLSAGKPAAPATATAAAPKRTTGNSAADMRRIFREK